MIVCDVDAVVEGRAEGELGALVKKLSSFSLRCSGSSSLTLASSMSLLMAVMRASTRRRDERKMKTCRKDVREDKVSVWERCKKKNNECIGKRESW